MWERIAAGARLAGNRGVIPLRPAGARMSRSGNHCHSFLLRAGLTPTPSHKAAEESG